MIILDTNVLSELMREEPNPTVEAWVRSQNASRLALTTVTLAEIQRGLFRLPKGKRRQRLETNFASFINSAFQGRLYSFDAKAAFIYGEISAKREQEGFNTDAIDLMIAAITKSNHASIATRNVKDFQGCGITIVNPWQA